MSKYLTERDWKVLTQKYKIKDSSLQTTLAAYEKLADNNYPERIKALTQVSQLAGNLKKAKECMAQSEVVKYLTEVVKAADAERKQVEAAQEKAAADAKAAAAAKAAATPPKPDPKMLEEVYRIGENDALNGKPSRSRLFAKAPDFQKKYDEGYSWGMTVAAKIQAKGPQPPQTSMGPISKEDADRAKEYAKRKQARKEFIQYLNQWWSTRLPEDL
jgi:hypothetical protein